MVFLSTARHIGIIKINYIYNHSTCTVLRSAAYYGPSLGVTTVSSVPEYDAGLWTGVELLPRGLERLGVQRAEPALDVVLELSPSSA